MICLVEDGDRIAIDIPNRRIEVIISADVLAESRVTMGGKVPPDRDRACTRSRWCFEPSLDGESAVRGTR